MAAVTICSDFEAQENKVCHCFHCFSFAMKWWDWIPWSWFSECWVLSQLFHNTQPWCAPFPILNQSIVPCMVQTVASWPAYRFPRRQVRWSGIPISLRIFHSLLWSTVKGFRVVNEAEVDVFLKFPCFFYDPVNVGNLISGSSSFSKSSLYTEISWFIYCWILAWKILSITLLACDMEQQTGSR